MHAPGPPLTTNEDQRQLLNTVILRAFGEANDRLETALGMYDVQPWLRQIGWYDSIDETELTERLTALVR